MTVIPRGTVPDDEMLRLHGNARVSIGLSISDGLPASLMEAVLMGSFPLQSDTGAADEWLMHGQTCLLVPPEDTGAVAAALRRALSDDALVDNAARANIAMMEERFSADKITSMTRDLYASVLSLRRIGRQ